MNCIKMLRNDQKFICMRRFMFNSRGTLIVFFLFFILFIYLFIFLPPGGQNFRKRCWLVFDLWTSRQIGTTQVKLCISNPCLIWSSKVTHILLYLSDNIEANDIMVKAPRIGNTILSDRRLVVTLEVQPLLYSSTTSMSPINY